MIGRIDQIQKGGYVLSDAPGAKAVLIATGSEVQLALAAQKLRRFPGAGGFHALRPASSTASRRTTGIRCCCQGVPRVAVEAGVTDFWRKYVGLEGAVVGIDRFGESAPAPDLFKHFGFTPENVVKAVRSVVQ